jgi:fructose-1,6-bisphosphatase/inositol monophosphatase family enzyme
VQNLLQGTTAKNRTRMVVVYRPQAQNVLYADRGSRTRRHTQQIQIAKTDPDLISLIGSGRNVFIEQPSRKVF